MSRDPARRITYLGLALVVAVFTLDQIAKFWVLSVLPCSVDSVACGRVELSPVMDLTLVWSRGVAFGSVLSLGQQIWTVVGSLVIVGLSVCWLFYAERWTTGWSLGLLIGGAVSNTMDRVRFGAVPDFLDFSGPWFGLRIGDWHVGFPWLFNLADAAVTIGATVVLIDQYFLAGTIHRPPAIRVMHAVRG